MIMLREMRVRSQLILLGCVMMAGFILFGLLSFRAINKIKVKGPIYANIVQDKDLVADILPPPEYILESYLVMYQAADEQNADKLKALHEKFIQLRKDFDERHDYWQKNLPDGQMKEMITRTSAAPAIAFYEKAEKDFFPALAARDFNKAKVAMADLKKDYELHRQSVDQLVKIANDQAENHEKLAESTITREMVVLLVILLMTILAAAAFAYLIARNLISQIGGEPADIAGIAHKVAEGDLTIQMDKSGKMSGIYASMAEMVASLRNLVQSINSNSQTIAAASEQLSASAEHMSRGVSQQSGRTSQIATSADEMSQTVVDIAQSASGIAAEAAGTGDLAKDGKDIVDQSVLESEAIAAVVERSSEKIINLSDQSKKIGDILNVIKDIADQTNLLALNAAIEAARAGEQGRGFAVVADEVRKLAERTSSATSEVASIIMTIQNEIMSASDSMGETTKKVRKGVELASRAGSALHEIVEGVHALQDKVRHIAGATEEMSTTSESISSDIQDIARVSDETSSNSKQIAQSSTDLARLAVELKELIVKFRV
ncbi:MAG TPA: methyl-accepting chemotaxis protein [Dissulfurispiraceae bacterium]|nr:methyl-accepting chemotaxis protein [Dissulfurispiraceae bacterium]